MVDTLYNIARPHASAPHIPDIGPLQPKCAKPPKGNRMQIEATTHEPETALRGYPESHVLVEDQLMSESSECLSVSIHGHMHYLHRTTAFALYQQLQRYFRNLPDIEKLALIASGSNLGGELF